MRNSLFLSVCSATLNSPSTQERELISPRSSKWWIKVALVSCIFKSRALVASSIGKALTCLADQRCALINNWAKPWAADRHKG
jgi:hypothetical protein